MMEQNIRPNNSFFTILVKGVPLLSHHKVNVLNAIEKLGINEQLDFKVVRIGKYNGKFRPTKVSPSRTLTYFK